MTTPDDIRSRMLRKAARLVNGIKNEEAWHLIGLFQQTHPNTFLQICHHTLASFLELTHDYFDQRWPLMSRLLITTNQKSTDNRRGRSRIHLINNTNSRRNNNIHEVFESPIGSPLCLSNQTDQWTCLSPVSSNVKISNSNHDEHVKKFKPKPGSKRLLKQLLPSMFPVPNSESKSAHVNELTPTKRSNRSNSKTKLFFKQQVQPLFTKSGGSNYETVQRQLTCPLILRLSSSKTIDYHLRIHSKWRNDYAGYCIRYCNVDSTICATLIDYMTCNPKLCQTEGIFRIPGNIIRIRELWYKLNLHFQTPYLRIPQPDPDSIEDTENLSPYPIINHSEIHEILQSYTPHDIASLILRCLSTCTEFRRIHQVLSFDTSTTTTSTTSIDSPICGSHYDTSASPHNAYSYNDGEYQQTGGLIPLEAGNLLFLATELQYKLINSTVSSPMMNIRAQKDDDLCQVTDNKCNEDWMYVLCQSRQLLAYRIVLQLLLPTPERYLLMNLLRLFKQIDEYNEISKMTAECLSRCTAFAVFGAPLKVKTSHSSIHNHHLSHKGNYIHNFESYTNSIKKRIDTLINLIKMAHQLEDLPAVIYQTVRSRLRTHLGNSPIPRTASRNHNIEKCNITNECCFDDDGSFMFQELIDYNNNNNDIQSAQSTCSNQKRVKCEHGIPELSIQTMNTEQMNLQSKPNNFQSVQRTKSNVDSLKYPLLKLKSINESQSFLPQNNLHPTTTNNASVDSFHLWKRHKLGYHQELMKSTQLMSISSPISKNDNCKFMKVTNPRNVSPSPHHQQHYHHKALMMKSRSSSFLNESHIFN
ncbi:hypothetical protein EWB00_003855 [Schistosoma japonicum]|uniref:Uncharacterized protein n=1 Tax=Schistosoma japonicum TaxID=6182 RepID=A0A4Z2D720_SCHJA|nr:hypothetical protein EWB00_003855 [Schistosoma japonicum]